jgi:hypothetical protein
MTRVFSSLTLDAASDASATRCRAAAVSACVTFCSTCCLLSAPEASIAKRAIAIGGGFVCFRPGLRQIGLGLRDLGAHGAIVETREQLPAVHRVADFGTHLGERQARYARADQCFLPRRDRAGGFDLRRPRDAIGRGRGDRQYRGGGGRCRRRIVSR